jgi:hypothetical protein
MMAAFLHRYYSSTHAVVGVDVSYPQCGKPLPTGQAFGIVGVNGGKPTIVNPCLSTQLAWAGGATGGTSQPRVQLYVNTANPGAVTPRVTSWPTSGTSARYGTTCHGLNDRTCAYVYGWNRAGEDLGWVAHPEDYAWWLDVELINSWDGGGTNGQVRNRAVLEGMLDRLVDAGVPQVGLYSTPYQWNRIVGAVPSGSPLNGRPSWLAGSTGTGIGGAERRCSSPPLTTGGRVVLSQYVEDGVDRDHSCA